MNCFVVMPFAPEFEDVYTTIKASVVAAVAKKDCRCFRLDETRPAGRITDRLLSELRAATLCIADLTGNRPNVMWEVGFAMALACPTIIVTQALAELPFDIKDMQSLEYDRSRLNNTLGQPLQRMVVDTISSHTDQGQKKPADRELVGELLDEVAELKRMVAQAVRSWNPSPTPPLDAEQTQQDLRNLEGAWINRESGSHGYSKLIGNDLIMPYCYMGNSDVTGAYFGWRKAGDYWFARYAWLAWLVEGGPAGFTFLKQESVDVLRGAYWGEEHGLGNPSAPPEKAGVPALWKRANIAFPEWAAGFLRDVEARGLRSCLDHVSATTASGVFQAEQRRVAAKGRSRKSDRSSGKTARPGIRPASSD